PASRVAFSGPQIELMPGPQDGTVLSCVTLCRAHVADATVTMFVVIPVDQRGGPLTSLLELSKALGWELRSVFRRAEKSLDEGVRVGYQLHLALTVKRRSPLR